MPKWSDSGHSAIAKKEQGCAAAHTARRRTVSDSGERGEHASNRDALIFRQDAFGAVMPAVVDRVVGVPSSAARAHLHQPRPDIAGRTMNGDGVVDRADGIGNQVISGESFVTLGSRCADLQSSVNCRIPSTANIPKAMTSNFFFLDIREYLSPSADSCAVIAVTRWKRRTRVSGKQFVLCAPNGTCAGGSANNAPWRITNTRYFCRSSRERL